MKLDRHFILVIVPTIEFPLLVAESYPSFSHPSNPRVVD